MKPTVVAVVCLLMLVSVSRAQRRELTLEQSVVTAVQKGFSASDVRARYRAARKSAESALRRLWTSVSLNASAPDYQEALSQQFNPLAGRYEYYQLKSRSLQGFLSVNQPLVFTGGNLRVSQTLLERNQTSGLTSAARQWNDYFTNFSLEFTQPLLTPNVSAITQTSNEIALAQAETDYLADQMELVYRVTESFYTLYQLSQRLAIVGEQVTQNEESYATARGKYEAGLIPEVEVLQSDVDLATSRNELLNTAREVERARNAFRLLLGIPAGEEVAAVGEVIYRPVLLDSAVAVGSALKNRTEVLSARRRVALSEGAVGMAKSQNGFRVGLTARYGLDRNDTLFRNVFQDFNRSRSVSLSLSIPLFDWWSHSLSVEAAEIQHENAAAAAEYAREQVAQEVIDLMNRIRVAESRIQVLEKTVAVAQKGYDISLQRFRNGAITRNDLTLAQQRLTSAKTNSLNALIDYRLGLADLKRKTLWDFEAGKAAEPVMPAD